jgi:hypothetical protein
MEEIKVQGDTRVEELKEANYEARFKKQTNIRTKRKQTDKAVNTQSKTDEATNIITENTQNNKHTN